MRGGVFNWPLRLGLIACCAVAPWFLSPWYAVALLMALPMLRALLDAIHEYPLSRVCVLCGCACAFFLLPAWLRPVIVLWGGGLTAMSFTHLRAGSRTIAASLALALASLLLTLGLILPRSGGQFIPWAAEVLVDAVDRHPRSATILLNAYQMGLARLEGRLALIPALRLGNILLIPPDTRLQMLYSLRTSLEILLKVWLPQGIICWLLSMALLPALAAEAVLRQRGRGSDLPPLSRWHLPRDMVNGVVVLMVLGFLPYLTDQPLLTGLGEMCYALGYWLCALQGAALMIALMLGRGMKPLLCGLLVLLVMATLPIVLFFLGGFDQFRDPRHLRGPRDETY